MATQPRKLTYWEHLCLRCNRTFVSESEHPQTCGKCKTRSWNTPPRAGGKGERNGKRIRT